MLDVGERRGRSLEREVIMEAVHLKKYFNMGNHQVLKAVDDVSFKLYKGETLGLVGESGCGKTTCGRTCIGLYPKTDGEVLYKGQAIHEMNRRQKKEFTSHVQMIFQDPYASLDPKMRVSTLIQEGMKIHKLFGTKEEADKRTEELLETVGLSREYAGRYIHEFSGGQRQRIGIARALAVEPEVLICDEPISALDVSIQAQIVNLLKRLQREMGFTYLFIAHDLAMVKYISDRVGVMYMGIMVELAPADSIYDNPLHPYTEALLSAIPIPDPDVEEARKRIALEGEVPNPINPPKGCRFAGRCPMATEQCREETPVMKEIEKEHFVACHRY